MNVDIDAVWQSPRGAAKAGCLLQLTWTQREHVNKSFHYIISPLFPWSIFSLHTEASSSLPSARWTAAWKWLMLSNSTLPQAFTMYTGSGDPLSFLQSARWSRQFFRRFFSRVQHREYWMDCCYICYRGSRSDVPLTEPRYSMEDQDVSLSRNL